MKTHRLHPDRGAVLIIVLWVVFGLVALTLYFAQSMSAEMRTADNRLNNAAAREAVEGGARYVTHVLSTYVTRGRAPLSTDYSPEELPVGDATCWLIGRDANLDPTAQPVFGLVDEGGKLNLNTATREMLEALPGMTPEFAAAIIDWRDANTQPSTNGAEDEVYARLDPPRTAKNAPFESADELRLVYGSTLDLLLGEDTNRNGALDDNENDSDRAAPLDDGDGQLRPGLLDYVTVYSRRPNTRADGSQRINVTAADQRTRLFQLLQQKFGDSRAEAIGAALGPGDVRSVAEFMIRGRFTADEFDQIESDLTAATGRTVAGLVNVNTAPAAVLACLPGIGAQNAPAIVNYRLAHPDSLTSMGWLGEVLDPSIVVAAGPYITGETYQFSADVAATGPFGRGYARTRFVYDLSGGTPRIVYREDLSGYGWALGRDVRQTFVAANLANSRL